MAAQDYIIGNLRGLISRTNECDFGDSGLWTFREA
jgi:hypothetical protein